MIVVDASLATKWFLNETDSDRARDFFNKKSGKIFGPDLLAIEVCRALVAAANSRRMDVKVARAAIAIWLDSVESRALIFSTATPMLIQHGVDIALALGYPLADCIYLALAIDLDCDLATCDAKFRDKAVPEYPRVKLLAEFS